MLASPKFSWRGVAFVDQTLDVNLAQRDVSVLIDAGDGIAPVVTMGRPASLHCSSRYLTILLNVAVGIRPGIQPSQ